MKNTVPVVIVGATVILVLAVGLWMQVGSVREPGQDVVGKQPATAPGGSARGGETAYSARVQERLQQLREDYAERQKQIAARPAAPQPPAAPEKVDGPGGRSEGTSAAREVRAPPPPAPALPPPLEIPPPPGSRHPAYALPHPPYLDQREDIQQLEDTILNNPASEKRLQALLKLSGEDEQEAVRVLAMAMNDPDPEVRATVIESLGDYPDLISADLLVPALKDPDAEVRFEAVGTLGALDGPAARAALQKALSDPDEDVRAFARGALDVRKGS